MILDIDKLEVDWVQAVFHNRANGFGIGPYVFKINSFNSHASMSMRKRKFCDNGKEEWIYLYPLSVMTGAFEEGEE